MSDAPRPSTSSSDAATVAGRRPAFMGGGGPVEKARDFRGTFKRLVAYLAPERSRFAVVTALAVASTVFSIAGPKVMGKATTKLADGVIARLMYFAKLEAAIHRHASPAAIEALRRTPIPLFDTAYIARVLGVMIVLYLVSGALLFIMSYLMSSVSQNVVYHMRNDLKAKLDHLPLGYFDQRAWGDILSRVTNDMDTIATTLQQSLTQVITAAVTVIGILLMMLTISPAMTLIALVSLPASAILTAVIAKTSQGYFVGQQQLLGELNGHVEEMLGGHKIVKAFGHERDSIERFEGLNERLFEVGWKAQFLSGVIFPAINFVNNVGFVLVCLVGGLLVARRKVEIGDIQAFIQYMRQFTQPLIRVANIANVLQSTMAAAERIFEVMDEAEQRPDPQPSVSLPQPHGDVRFDRVSFRYKAEEPLIHDLSIDVKAGQMVAIVGPTGAGKTTLVNLLMRFYEIDGGAITVDGIDTRAMTRRDLRMLFGMVLQDTWLFHGTIRDNIRYGREDATDDQIHAAAATAHADHFIRALPDGYDTVLNEEASNISQGQKQLLTIARAVLADPPMLILDEATSNVDTRTEALIQSAMANLMSGRTSFVIAHRLSTIRDADLILVMRDGTIIEQGDHPTLLAQDGFYASLYNSQFLGHRPAPQLGG